MGRTEDWNLGKFGGDQAGGQQRRENGLPKWSSTIPRVEERRHKFPKATCWQLPHPITVEAQVLLGYTSWKAEFLKRNVQP